MPDEIHDFAQRRGLPKKEIAGLGEPQGQQIVRPFPQHGDIALGSNGGMSRSPGVRSGEVSTLARTPAYGRALGCPQRLVEPGERGRILGRHGKRQAQNITRRETRITFEQVLRLRQRVANRTQKRVERPGGCIGGGSARCIASKRCGWELRIHTELLLPSKWKRFRNAPACAVWVAAGADGMTGTPRSLLETPVCGNARPDSG